MQLSELIQRLSKLHEIHGDVAVMSIMEEPVSEVTFSPHGDYNDAPYIEIDFGVEE